MYLRVVTVTIAPGKVEAYWAWAKEVIDLWDEAGVVRAGGPYRGSGAAGEALAIWLTLHASEEDIRGEFERLYASGRGRELMQERPALVAATSGEVHAPWRPAAAAPPPAPMLAGAN